MYTRIQNLIHRKYKRVSLVTRNSIMVRYIYYNNCYKMFLNKNFIDQSFQELHPGHEYIS
jgi:hypothetical protein